MKLQEIATKIYAHLKRFEGDSKINTSRGKGLKRYFTVGAYTAGSKIGVTYISYQGAVYLTKAEAAKYLKWLDAGNVGTFWESLKK